MKSFDSYFGDSSIIDALCRMRVRQARQQQEVQQACLAGKNQAIPDRGELRVVFPPRREWHAHRPLRRKGVSADSVNFRALREAIRVGRSRQPDALWAQRLVQLVNRIRSRALSPDKVEFAAPRIVPIPKTKGGLEVRPIAIYSVEDRIVQSLSAQYLRDVFDAALDRACLAFRSSAGVAKPPQHHDTVVKLLEMNERYGSHGLYVAEADLRCFFDSVDHDVAKECIAKLVQTVRTIRPAQDIDLRALQILDAYLDSYAVVPNVISPEELCEPPAELRQKPYFPWPIAVLSELHPNLREARIGVPQGGALSGVLVNAVLNQADQAVRRVINSVAAPVLYLRYVDDMILLSPCREACTKCFYAYCAAVKALKLPVHAPLQINRYEPDYWKAKSKAPFLWGEPHDQGGIPWISFLGYEIRFDEHVRVRKASIQKHRRRIIETVDKSLAEFNARRLLDPPLPGARSVAAFLRRLRFSLSRTAVGRANIGSSQVRPLPRSWTSGFRGLLQGHILSSQMRGLDRHLERQLRRAERRLGYRRPPAGLPKVTRFRRPVFRGFPFSYAGQFDSHSRHEPGQSPNPS